MFAKSIVLTDAFLDMPMSARCLYFTLGMLADDDGFVGSPRSIMRQCGASQDDMNVLLMKRYVLACESGVIVIKHWRMNNYLQNDRHHPTTYQEELATLTTDQKGAYIEKPGVYTECIQDVYRDKSSKDKNSLVENKAASPLDLAMKDFVEFRKKIKKPMTDRAIELTLAELEKLAPGDEKAKIAILNQSIQRGWQGVFPLSNDQKPKAKESREPVLDDTDRLFRMLGVEQ